MNAETTTCISFANDAIIKAVGKKYNISVSKLLVLMVRYATERRQLTLKSCRNVQYRDKKGKGSWKRIHLQLNPNEYEFLMDVKKIWKVSVARMLEFCIENYLFDLQEKVLEKNKTDNYLYNNYHFEIGEEEGILYCLVYWGLPQKVLQKIIQNSLPAT